MNFTYLDFAQLADFEFDSGAPIIWPSWANVKRCPSIAETQVLDVNWAEVRQIVVRWGDPRINLILEYWRMAFEAALRADRAGADNSDIDFKKVSYYRMHDAAHVKVVFYNWMFDFAVIPKMLGTPNTESEKDELLDHEFRPEIYDRSGIPPLVLEWGMGIAYSDITDAENCINNARARHQGVYLRTQEYVLQPHLGAQIDRQVHLLEPLESR